MKINTKVLGLVLLAFITLNKISAQKKSKKQNIIFLLTDDQRWDALSCMGNKEISTPNIDKIAEKGVMFTNFYNTTSICMASRAQMMTGMYEFKTGCNFTHGPLTKKKFQKSYPVLLRKAGYKTGFTGKFGYAVKENADAKAGYAKMEDLPVDEFDWWKGWPSQGYYQTAKNKHMVEYAEKHPHVSGALGAASVDFIKEYSNKKEPFCLSVSFKAPHNPVSPDPQYDHIYKGKTFTKNPNFGQEGAKHLPKQSKLGRQYQRLGEHWNAENYDYAMSRYYQLIHGIDVAVGMILDELEKQGEADNTVIIFTTDNGYSTGAHGFGGKVLPYEEGAKGPLLIYAPGSKSENKGWKSHAITGNIDMTPTILDIAGVDIPDNVDGKSLIPLLEKKNASVKDHQAIIQAWGESPTHSLSVVSDDYKYLYWFYADGMEAKEELYNLKEDKYEMNNLAQSKSEAKQLKKMQTIYDSYVARIKKEGAPLNRYIEYGTLYDRHVSWEDKKDLIKEYIDPSKRKPKKSKKQKKDKKDKKGKKGKKGKKVKKNRKNKSN